MWIVIHKMQYLNRELEKTLNNLIETRPIIYLSGPRQVGKSTIVNNIKQNINYLTFDSPILFNSAKNNPESFLNSLPKDKINIIDEVQLVPELFNYLKMAVDSNRLTQTNNNCFILTGSANLMALPMLSQALVGRMSVLKLLQFSSSEYLQTSNNFIERLLKEDLTYKKYENYDFLDIMQNATFPEIAINKNIDRIKWIDDYLTTILQRDTKIITDIRNPEKIIMLLNALSMRVGGLVNNCEIASEIGLDRKTYDKYKNFIINTFLCSEIKPWAPLEKIIKRFAKSSKLYFSDINLLTYILKRKLKNIYEDNKIMFGHIFENFIALEIVKNLTSLNNIKLSHFRTSDNKEVDFILENYNNEMIAIKVKSSSIVDTKDIKHLIFLKDLVKDRFKKGIVFYTGNEIVSLADKIWAVPIVFLWNK